MKKTETSDFFNRWVSLEDIFIPTTIFPNLFDWIFTTIFPLFFMSYFCDNFSTFSHYHNFSLGDAAEVGRENVDHNCLCSLQITTKLHHIFTSVIVTVLFFFSYFFIWTSHEFSGELGHQLFTFTTYYNKFSDFFFYGFHDFCIFFFFTSTNQEFKRECGPKPLMINTNKKK